MPAEMWRKLTGGFLVGAGLLVGLGIVFGFEETDTLLELSVYFMSFSVAPTVGGWALWRSERRRRRRLLEREAEGAWEAEILRLAQAHHNHMTVREVAGDTGLPVARAEAVLDQLCRQGVAEHRITDDGTIVYQFTRLLTSEEKSASSGVLDGPAR